MKEIIISTQDENQRMDKFLKKFFKEASSGFLYKMLRKKNITLNGKKASGAELLVTDDCIQVYFSEDTFDKMRGLQQTQMSYEVLKALPYDLKVIYEDEEILIVDKPAGVLSQKATNQDVSLNEMILSYLIHTNQLSLEQYRVFHPSVANRLDRNTSGLLLAGKTLAGQQQLSRMLNDRSVRKIYHCIVRGRMEEEQHLRGYLSKDETSNTVTILSQPVAGAKQIETAYRPLASNGRQTLLEVHLITGRTHQIRAHLASIGHAVIGDYKYGSFGVNSYFKKSYHLEAQLLHAWKMEFPICDGALSGLSGKTVTAPIPEMMEQIIKGEHLAWQPGIQEDCAVQR